MDCMHFFFWCIVISMGALEAIEYVLWWWVENVWFSLGLWWLYPWLATRWLLDGMTLFIFVSFDMWIAWIKKLKVLLKLLCTQIQSTVDCNSGLHDTFLMYIDFNENCRGNWICVVMVGCKCLVFLGL